MPFLPPRSSGGVPRQYRQSSRVPFQSRRQGRPYYNIPPGQPQPFYNNPPGQQQPFYNPGPYQQQQPFNGPYYQQPFNNQYFQQQPQGSNFGRLPDQLNRIMGHAGTITNGVNMMRQMGAIFSLFR